VSSLGKLAAVLGVPPGVATVLEAALKEMATVASSGSNAIESQAEQETKSLPDLKSELACSLTELDRPILVIMDDIDRLTAREIRLLFQLVKANADLPNLVFFLLFQRDLVEKSLDEVAPASGAEFLDKIVQIGFDVPQLDPTRLRAVLDQGLTRVFGSESIPRAEHVRFGNLFHGGLSGYFENLRDVYRFLSTLEFHAAAHRSEGVLNVNVVDLVGIECLRVFDPDVFRQLPGLKVVLTELGGSLDGKEKRKSLENLLGDVPETRRDQVCEVLKSLFQPVEWVLSGSGYGHGFEEGWARGRRICAGGMFDRYAQLALGAHDVSEAEV
jgi:predicted KAP-like P-loop ATPase